MAVGDIMLGSTYVPGQRRPRRLTDDEHLLAGVAPTLTRADLTFGNLEGPLAEGGRPRGKCKARPEFCYLFRMPPRYAAQLKMAGFNVVSTANNHAFDFGEPGYASTLRALNSVGIAHSGGLGDVAHLLVKGRKVDLIAFSTSMRTYDLRNLEQATQLVEHAAQQADIVMVSFHGGGEGTDFQFIPPGGNEFFLEEDRGDVVRFARAMIDAGAHLVVGHGPHVVRAMEIYRGRLIAYSLGNFATSWGINVKGPEGLSLILEVRLARDGSFNSARVYPIRQGEAHEGPRLDADASILPVLRELSATQFGESAVLVADNGELSLPPPPLPPPPR
jgi:poly-gamma-glutamate capsule biosynthesis protein CapA/YwtB (metallophosphatase superfamily)